MLVSVNGVQMQVTGKQGIRGMAGPDGNPIGTVIDYMGKTAPNDYLICNGDTYQISNWPDLADFFEAQYGRKDEFGGNGTSSFGVPTLSSDQGVLKCIKAKKEDPYENIYSTEKEIVVGRWINGKPIYRKCYNIVSPNAGGLTTVLTLDNIIDSAVNLYGSLKATNNTTVPLNFDADNYYNISTFYRSSDFTINMMLNQSMYMNCQVYMVFEYTKTTDKPSL